VVSISSAPRLAFAVPTWRSSRCRTVCRRQSRSRIASSTSLTNPGKRVFFDQGIDLLDALPEPEVFGASAFTQENYPRKIERVNARRERYARFLVDAGQCGGRNRKSSLAAFPNLPVRIRMDTL
jgi:hypothetical protein